MTDTDPGGGPALPAPDADTVVVLTEEVLEPGDARRLTDLHPGEQLRYLVLVPADTERNLLVDVLDHLSLLELREALEALRGRPSDAASRSEATQTLDRSVAALRATGVAVDGELVEDDPVAMLREAVRRHPVREVIVVTRPHAVEDTFHRDWASRAREVLGVPVLHVYAGTTFLG